MVFDNSSARIIFNFNQYTITKDITTATGD